VQKKLIKTEMLDKIKPCRPYTRIGDMDFKTALNVYMQDDGDFVLWVGHPFFPSDEKDKIEFCNIGMGGGRSEHTWYALKNLIKAIRADNEENPISIKL
jgi:hypothetical protein